MYIRVKWIMEKKTNLRQKGLEFKLTKLLEKTNKHHQRELCHFTRRFDYNIFIFQKLQGQKSFKISFRISGFYFILSFNLHYITIFFNSLIV